jgi:hypothetical protein
MITVMTLDLDNQPSAESLHNRFVGRGSTGLDILCCQSMPHAVDSRDRQPSVVLAETLGLTCSCFAACRDQGGLPVRGSRSVRGLATLTGSGVWVLNSGSFTVGSAGTPEVVQFALVRKNGVSVLVLNLHFVDGQEARQQQLTDLFAHPLLKEPYGAVVLCADREMQMPLKLWQTLANRSSYSVQRHCLITADHSLLCLLTARCEALAMVTVDLGKAAWNDGTGPDGRGGLAMEFEMQRRASDRHHRPLVPLSFREQWLGYREHRSFA